MKRETGFTLIELMIAMVLGLFVLGVTITLYVSNVTTNASTLGMTRLNQELRLLMTVVAGDIRRSGYWGNSHMAALAGYTADLHFNDNTGTNVPFTQRVPDELTAIDVLGTLNGLGANVTWHLLHRSQDGATHRIPIVSYNSGTDTLYLNLDGRTATDTSGTAIAVPALTGDLLKSGTWTIENPFLPLTYTDDANGDGTTGDSCIIFAIDDLDNGSFEITSSPTPSDYFGYRYDSTNMAIETRRTNIACNVGGWSDLSDPDTTEVTAFDIVETTTDIVTGSAGVVTIRDYAITIDARVKNEPTITRRVQETVRVRTDRVR